MSEPIEKWCSLGLGDGRRIEITSQLFADGTKKHFCTFNFNPNYIVVSTEEIYNILKQVDYPDEEIPEYLLKN